MRSIKNRLTLTTILWVGLILAAGQLVVDQVVSNWLLQQFDTALESKARALVTLTKNDGVEVELDFADEFMPEFEAPENPEYFELFLGDGRLLERSRSFRGHADSIFEDQADEVRLADIELPDGRSGRRISIRFVPQIEDKSLRPLIPLAQRPRALLRVGRERESLDEIRSRFHWLIFATSLVVLAAVAFSVARSTRSGLAPLIRIKDEIGRISPREIDRRIPTDGQPEELEPIATQFNRVLGEIEKAFIRERQFSSDVAHELRTPVAEIRSLAEVGSRWPDEKDIRSYFADIHESARHLDRLIENLLNLCRSDDGNVEVENRPIELAPLLAKIRQGVADEAGQRSIELAFPDPGPLKIRTDPQWFELILQNLVLNAVAHSPDGARIELRLAEESAGLALEIDNPMREPLSPRDLERIFDRFWRKDSARETGRHAGIGLSLVKAYAGLTGLEIGAQILPENRLRLRVADIQPA